MDPSIILAGKSPVYEPLAVAAARQQTLKNAIMANQHTAVMNPQIEQAGALGLQQQQRAERDQQIYADAIANRARSTLGATAGGPAVAGGLMDPGMISDLAKGGMSGGGLQGVTQNYLKQLETKSIADKNAAESKHYDVETAGLRLRAAGNAANAVRQLPVEQRPAGYARARADLILHGYATADQIPEQYPGDDVLQQMSDQAIEADKLQAMKIKQNEETRAAALAPFQLQTARTNATVGQLGLAGQTLGSAANQDQWTAARNVLPEDQRANVPVMFSQQAAADARRVGMSGEQQTAADQAAANAAETARRNTATAANEAAMRQQGNARLGLEQQGLNLRRVEVDPFGTLGLNPHPPSFAQPGADGQALTGKPFLDAIAKTNPGLANRIAAAARGDDTYVPRGKEGERFKELVAQFDPSYSDVRGTLRKAFTVGKQGQQIGNLNTAAVHSQQAMDVFNAMNNGTFTPGNEAYNWFATKFGAPQSTDFATIRNILAGEQATAYKGSATDPEIAAINHTYQTAASPKQAAGALNQNLHGIAAKLNTYDEQYHQSSGKDDPWSPVLPGARAVFDRNGISPLTRDAKPAARAGAAGGGAPGQVMVTDPKGGQHFFPSQKEADAFRRAARI